MAKKKKKEKKSLTQMTLCLSGAFLPLLCQDCVKAKDVQKDCLSKDEM